jgi:hypothetical protein
MVRRPSCIGGVALIAYATPDDVNARAGRLRASFGLNGAPGDDEIRNFLDDVAGDIDMLLAAKLISIPLADPPEGVSALRAINADGALIIALAATFPSDVADTPAARVMAEAKARFDTAMRRLEDGTHPLVQFLSTGTSKDAADFWSENPQYDATTRYQERLVTSPSILPGISKSERF